MRRNTGLDLGGDICELTRQYVHGACRNPKRDVVVSNSRRRGKPAPDP